MTISSRQLHDPRDLDDRLSIPIVAVPRLTVRADHMRPIRSTMRRNATIWNLADTTPLQLLRVKRQDAVIVVPASGQ